MVDRKYFKDVTKNLTSGDTITISVDDFNQGVKEVQQEMIDVFIEKIIEHSKEARKSGAGGKEWMMSALSLLKDDIEELKYSVYGG